MAYRFTSLPWRNTPGLGGIVLDINSYCLLGCTVSPGFDFSDFEMGNRELLMSQFPDYKKSIETLT
jgi:hypothetical protein